MRVELADKRTFDAKVVGTDPASDLARAESRGARSPHAPHRRLEQGQRRRRRARHRQSAQRRTDRDDGHHQRERPRDRRRRRPTRTSCRPMPRSTRATPAARSSTPNGELVGINWQILTPTGGNIGLGFAIPSNMARHVMDQLKTDGKVSRSRLGVTVQNVTADIASSLKLSDIERRARERREPGSAADNAGLRQGDVIVGSTAKNSRTTTRFVTASPQQSRGRKSRWRFCVTAAARRSMRRSNRSRPRQREPRVREDRMPTASA